MDNWYDSVKGRYFAADKRIGLDYGKLFLDPIDAEITLFHETVHSVISAETEFGQATQTVLWFKDFFNHVQDKQNDKFCGLFFEAQDFVQEGFATFLQISRLRKLTDKNIALNWAQTHFPPEYLEKFNKLVFALDYSQVYRDFFTAKISHLAMETGIRKNAKAMNLFKDIETLRKYLADDGVNPNKRLEKILDTVRYKRWVVTKPISEIAAACGVPFFESSSKDDVAGFMTYVAQFTNNPHNFHAADIGDLPPANEILKQANKSVIVGNMNFDFEESGIPLFKIADFLHYSDQLELVFVSLDDGGGSDGYRDYLKQMTGNTPEVTLGGFVKTGEKYITATTKEIAANLLNKELKGITLLVKWGGFDLSTNKFIWSKEARTPELIIYNTADDIQNTMQSFLKNNPKTNFEYLIVGASENHPLLTLIIKFEDMQSLHVVNVFGNVAIMDFINACGNRAVKMELNVLRSFKKDLNNLFSCWNGLSWDIDWVDTMLDGKEVHLRNAVH